MVFLEFNSWNAFLRSAGKTPPFVKRGHNNPKGFAVEEERCREYRARH
jgi:hypothetical protein